MFISAVDFPIGGRARCACRRRRAARAAEGALRVTPKARCA
jgi:hypothetical protein